MRNKSAVTGHPALLPALGKFLFPVPPPLAPETKCPLLSSHITKQSLLPDSCSFTHMFMLSAEGPVVLRWEGPGNRHGPVIALLSKPSLVLSAPEGGGFFLNCLSYRTFISNEKKKSGKPHVLHQVKASCSGQSCVRATGVSPVQHPLGIFSDTVGKPLAWTVSQL